MWLSTLALAMMAAPAESVMYPASIYPASPVSRHASEVPLPAAGGAVRYGFNQACAIVPRHTYRIDQGGDGQTDCTPALRAALEQAKACGEPAEIVFGAGRYRFASSPQYGSDQWAIVSIDSPRDLVIRGQGDATTLVAGDSLLGLLRVVDGENVQLRDFRVDYNPLPFTQGTVTAVDAAAGTFDLRLTPGYPLPPQIDAARPEMGGCYQMVYSPEGRVRWPSMAVLAARSPAELPSGEWRFAAPGAELRDRVKAGTELAYVGRRIGQHALLLWRTRGVWISGVTVHASPGCGLVLTSVNQANIDGYSDMIPVGSDRFIATDADGLYVHGARGGVTIANACFSGQGDDCINLHTPAYYGRTLGVVNDTHLTLRSQDDFRAGDILEIMDPKVGRIKGQLRVAAVQRDAAATTVALELAAGLSTTGFDPATDRIYPVSLAVPSFRITHCYFGPHRGRTMLIQARDGLIEGNTVENAEGYGMVLGYGGTDWPEGVIPARVTIRDNVFRNTTNVGMAAAIEILDGSDQRNYRDLTIERNRFLCPRKMAVRATGVQGLTLRDNTVESEPGRRMTWNDERWWRVDCSLFLDNCGGATVERWRVRDPGIKDCAVFISGSCDAGEAGVCLRELSVELAPGIAAVRDERGKPQP